jgi:hypothetical protein
LIRQPTPGICEGIVGDADAPRLEAAQEPGGQAGGHLRPRHQALWFDLLSARTCLTRRCRGAGQSEWRDQRQDDRLRGGLYAIFTGITKANGIKVLRAKGQHVARLFARNGNIGTASKRSALPRSLQDNSVASTHARCRRSGRHLAVGMWAGLLATVREGRMTIVSNKIMDAVYEALPTDGSGAAPVEVHRKIDMWSRSTVMNALTQLHEEGRVTFTGPNGRRQYRRVS